VLATATVVFTLPLLLGWVWGETVGKRLEGSPWRLPVQTTAWACWIFAMFVFYRTTAQDFVYFQF